MRPSDLIVMMTCLPQIRERASDVSKGSLSRQELEDMEVNYLSCAQVWCSMPLQRLMLPRDMHLDHSIDGLSLDIMNLWQHACNIEQRVTRSGETLCPSFSCCIDRVDIAPSCSWQSMPAMNLCFGYDFQKNEQQLPRCWQLQMYRRH